MGSGESRALFRAAVSELKGRPIGSSDAIWDRVLGFTGGYPDVVTLLQLDDVREIRDGQPRNLALLVVKLIGALKAASEAPKKEAFPGLLAAMRILARIMPALQEAPQNPLGYDLFWRNRIPAKERKPAGDAEAPAAAAADGAEAEAPAADDAETKAPAAAGTAGEGGEGDVAAAASGAVRSFTRVGAEGDPEVGRQLVHTIMALLFLPGFTVDENQYKLWAVARRAAAVEEQKKRKQQKEGGGDAGEGEGDAGAAAERADAADGGDDDKSFVSATVEYMLLWNGGVGFPDHKPVQSATLDANRVETLRLLLVVLCSPLFHPQDPSSLIVDRFAEVAVAPDCPLAPTLFYSLINSAVGYDPVGWGVPYGSALVRDEAEPLMVASLHTLGVLLDYKTIPPAERGGPPRDAVAGEEASAGAGAAAAAAAADGGAEEAKDAGEAAADATKTKSKGPLPVYNIHRGLLAGLRDRSDLERLYKGTTNLLCSVYESDNTYLPFSAKKITCFQEVLVLLWKALDENGAFLSHVLQNEDITRVVTPLCYFMWVGKAHPQRVGLINICTFNLLLLSGFRNFGVDLNKPFNVSMPIVDLPRFEGSHADFLIIVMHKLVVAGHPALRSLHPWYLTILCNISPYVKNVGLVASTKLMLLWEAFSSPKFLLAARDNHSFVEQMLEVFNNFIQYQYEGSTHLVYAMVRKQETFRRLTALSVADAAAKAKTKPATPPRPPASAGDEAGAGGDADAAETGGGGGGGSSSGGAGDAAAAAAADGGAADGEAAEAGGAVAASEEPRWKPTEKWLNEWKSRLPLGALLRLLDVLAPKVEEFCARGEGSVDDAAVIEFLKATTMVGLLPQPHPIVMRKYQPNLYTNLWFTTFLWGLVYMHHQELPLFDSATIKLFAVNVVKKKAEASKE